MSHAPIEFSPKGTPLLDRGVGELVAERPNRSRIFQAHKIDFCCQGTWTLRQACERQKIDPAAIVKDLEDELAGKPDDGENPALLPADQLCEYIVEKHHRFLRDELPRLFAMSERVARVHGGRTASLIEVFQVFGEMSQELLSHIEKEETIVFPAVVSLSRGEITSVPLAVPLSVMFREHDETAEFLKSLRELTNDFSPPSDACNTYRALFAGLHDLEGDLQKHIHLENAVLFPAARKMVAEQN